MAIPFRTNVDLRQNQIIRRVIEKLAVAPAGPVAGQEYYNTADNCVYVWNGTVWTNLSAPSGEINTVSNVGVGGVGVFKQKTGVNLELRNINAGSTKVSVALDAVNNEIEVDVVEANLNIVNMTGILPVTRGGTGVATLTGIAKGNGVGVFTPAVAGTDYLAPVAAPVVNQILTTTAAGVPQVSGKTFNDVGTTVNDVWSALQVGVAINNAFASQDAMIYAGVIDASTNPNYPAANRGATYKISVAGRIGGAAGPVVEVGDMLICGLDGSVSGTHAVVGVNWAIIQTNVDGAVTGPASSVSTHLAIFNGVTGKVLQNSSAYITGNDLISIGGVFKNTNQPLVGSYRVTIGTGALTTFAIAHNLNSLAAQVTIREVATGITTYGDVVRVDANNMTISFTVAPAASELEVTVQA